MSTLSIEQSFETEYGDPPLKAVAYRAACVGDVLFTVAERSVSLKTAQVDELIEFLQHRLAPDPEPQIEVGSLVRLIDTDDLPAIQATRGFVRGAVFKVVSVEDYINPGDRDYIKITNVAGKSVFLRSRRFELVGGGS
ncbi:MAG: hypothetical protein AAGA99_00525 [Actinomycetota bacterium]